MSKITKDAFNVLCNGARVIASNEGGVTYKGTDGRMFAQIYNGSYWEYVIIS